MPAPISVGLLVRFGGIATAGFAAGVLASYVLLASLHCVTLDIALEAMRGADVWLPAITGCAMVAGCGIGSRGSATEARGKEGAPAREEPVPSSFRRERL